MTRLGTVVLCIALGVAAVVGGAGGAGAVPPGKDGRIVFQNANQDDGSDDLWTMNADGSDLRDITPNTTTADLHQPSWSPDGKRIAFTSAAPGADTPAAVYVMNADGTNMRKIAADAFENSAPAWSPDGKLIAFGRCSFVLETGECSSAQIAVVKPNGTKLRKLTRPPHADVSVVDSEPAWAPDGKRLVFTRKTSFSEFSLWILTMKGKKLRELYADQTDDYYGPTWSPDGKRIAFMSDAPDLDTIFSVAPSGKGRQKILEDTEDPDNDVYAGGLSDPAYSPSGSSLTYWSAGEIWRVSATGSGPTQLTQDGGDYPDWGRASK